MFYAKISLSPELFRQTKIRQFGLTEEQSLNWPDGATYEANIDW